MRPARGALTKYRLAAGMIAGLVTLCAVPTAVDGANVEVVVNSSLYAGGQITAGLNQYLQDITDQGYTPILTTSSFADPAALRSHLANRRATQGLAGAVFVGDLPIANYEIAAHSGWAEENFPCDLYYQDLDGLWIDGDSDGAFDIHAGAVGSEIWMGRLTTSPLVGLHAGRSEASMLNEYFTRNHAYRTGQLSVADNCLGYIDDDWIVGGTSWAGIMRGAVGGLLTTVNDGATTTAVDYANRLQTEYEHVLLLAHSNANLHRFKIGDEWTGGDVTAAELEGIDPQVLFYNLFACSNADFAAVGYMGGEYVFGTDKGLLAVGSSKTGSMQGFSDYFDPLGAGDTFGEAWENWWQKRAAGGFTTSETDWLYGMTMLGDPLLLTQEYIPEPASIALLAAGAALILGRRRG